MPIHRWYRALATAALGVAAFQAAAPARATDVVLPSVASAAGYGAWAGFAVSDLDSATFGTEWIDNVNTLSAGFGSALTFSFTIAAGQLGTLVVVDAGFAGDTFRVTNFGVSLGTTSSVPVTTYSSGTPSVASFDAALANPAFSRGTYVFGAGTYRIGGSLAQSVLLDGDPLNSTLGGVRLTTSTVAAVPEPSTWALFILGIAGTGLAVRRRAGRH